jgi:hypothetical protein
MSKNQYTFFFILLIGIPLFVNAISISPNVQFSFGCPAGNFPKNCSGNYYFEVSNLTFFRIQLFENKSRWNNKDICRPTPFFQYVYDYPDIFNWECCISDWVAHQTSCTIGDNQTLYYTDNNNCIFPSGLPPDNGSISFCNYCSESLYPTYGDCNENSTQTVNYIDLSQLTCCDITNLPTDCSIRTYPYNDTTFQACNSTSVNIGTPICRNNPELADTGQGSKEDCVIEIPAQYRNEAYKCFSIVKEKDTGQIVQVNPDQNRSNPVLESRDYFPSLYSMVNFYYTSENLIPEKDYVVRMECSSPNRIIYSEYPITRSYENLSWIYYRILWLKGNASYILGGIILFVLISVVALLIMKVLR